MRFAKYIQTVVPGRGLTEPGLEVLRRLFGDDGLPDGPLLAALLREESNSTEL